MPQVRDVCVPFLLQLDSLFTLSFLVTVLLLLEVMAQPVEALCEDANGESGPSKPANKKSEYGKVLSVSSETGALFLARGQIIRQSSDNLSFIQFSATSKHAEEAAESDRLNVLILDELTKEEEKGWAVYHQTKEAEREAGH